jgi:acetyl-CoA synthetase
MYEGAPDWPDRDRIWNIIEQHGVSILYTAPTAIRAFMKCGTDWPAKHDLSSLRLLGSVGEPINPEAWMWYYEQVGGKRCPIVDTWWQTETGMIMITTLPGVDAMTPGAAGKPVPGIRAAVFNGAREPVTTGGGLLAITHPWPAMLRGIWGDAERYKLQYWSKWDTSTYFAADGAKLSEDGYYTLLGRVDDVLNVAGHRIGTMEIESALVDDPAVAEAAAVGVSHPIKGQALVAFVTLKEGFTACSEMETELKEHVVRKIGAIARPERIVFSADLPKTRSGKIMRRLLRDIGEGKIMGDTSTLADATVVEKLRLQYEEKEEA